MLHPGPALKKIRNTLKSNKARWDHDSSWSINLFHPEPLRIPVRCLIHLGFNHLRHHMSCIWHLNWTQVCIFNTHAITYEDTWGGTIHVFKFVCNKVYTVTWCMQPAYIFGQIYIHAQADSRFAPNIFEFSACRVEHVPDKIKGMFATRYISRIVVKSNMRWCHGKVEPVQSSTWVNKINKNEVLVRFLTNYFALSNALLLPLLQESDS